MVLFGGSSSPFNRSGGYLNGSDGLLNGSSCSCEIPVVY